MTKEIIENDPYKLAGVDIEAGEDLIKKIKNDVASTHGIMLLEILVDLQECSSYQKNFKIQYL